MLIVPPDHSFAELSTVPMESLAGEVFLGGEAATGTGTLLKRAFGPLAGNLKCTRTWQHPSGEAGVMAGWGISIVFRSEVAEELRAGTLVALPISGCPLEKKLYVVWRKELGATSPGDAIGGLSQNPDFIWGEGRLKQSSELKRSGVEAHCSSGELRTSSEAPAECRFDLQAAPWYLKYRADSR